jgi:hypothetical protein
VINANRPVGTYWVSLRALGECEADNIYQEALLIYEGATSDGFLVSQSPGPRGLPQGVVSNRQKAVTIKIISFVLSVKPV